MVHILVLKQRYVMTHTNFIYENDTWLDLDSQWEDRSGELLWFAVPLVRQSGGLQVDELASWGFGGCLGNKRLPTPRRPIQQHPWGGDRERIKSLIHLMPKSVNQNNLLWKKKICKIQDDVPWSIHLWEAERVWIQPVGVSSGREGWQCPAAHKLPHQALQYPSRTPTDEEQQNH